jgi:heptosyltransferase-2/heptosyltransferase-3
LDREALVYRNRSMAEAFHAVPLKHHLRGALLKATAQIPIVPSKPGSTERILLIRPDHLGDVLLATPAIHALRAAQPEVEIHMLVGPWSADVIANYPEIDQVLTLPFPGFSREPNDSLRSPYELALRASRQLRWIGYHRAVIMRPDHWWGALLAYLAGIPERIGYNHADVAPFLTTTLSHRYDHAVVQNLRLVEKWTGVTQPEDAVFRFPVNDADRAYVEGYLQEWGIRPSQPIIGFHPGSGTWIKRWQDDRWAYIADILAEQLDAPAVFTGGDHELPMVRRIVARMKQPACIMVGDTRVGQLAALFARARVVLGPDSGPLHLAAAVGAPTVTLFGPADPAEFGPWGSRQKHFVLTSDIGCRPCRVLDWGDDDPAFHPCVRDINAAQVLDAARRAAQHERV